MGNTLNSQQNLLTLANAQELAECLGFDQMSGQLIRYL